MKKHILVLAIFAATSAAFAQDAATQSQLTLDRLMTAEEVREMGLHKLSEAERRKLGAWLLRLVGAVADAVPAASPPSAAAAAGTAAPENAAPSVIESRIDGEFEGWTGSTVFKLGNGQIWQQTSYAYHYHYAYGPKVMVYKDGGTFRMKVDGVNSTVAVRRLK
jgi:hypothetical protein